MLILYWLETGIFWGIVLSVRNFRLLVVGRTAFHLLTSGQLLRIRNIHYFIDYIEQLEKKKICVSIPEHWEGLSYRYLAKFSSPVDQLQDPLDPLTSCMSPYIFLTIKHMGLVRPVDAYDICYPIEQSSVRHGQISLLRSLTFI